MMDYNEKETILDGQMKFTNKELAEINEEFRSLKYFRESYSLVNFMIQPHLMHINIMPAGTASDPEHRVHSHRTFEFSFVVHGHMKYRLDDKDITVFDNDLIMIPPDTSHFWLAVKESVVFSFMLFVHCHGDGARENMNRLREAIIRNKHIFHDFSEILIGYNEITKEIQQCETGYDERIQCFSRLIYSGIIRKLLPDFQINLRTLRIPPQRGNTDVSIVELIQYYIQDNLSKKIMMRDISAYIGISVNQMCRIFKTQHGISVQQYLTNTRIKYSCNLLVNSDRLLKDIATESGYEDTDYFCRVFRKYRGMTPSQYRRLNG